MSAFRAYHLPPDLEPATARRFLEGDPGGRGLLEARVERAEAERLLAALEEAGEGLRDRSNDELTAVLGRAAARFLDPGDPLRAEAEEWLVPEAGLSPPMARLVVERMAADWSTDALRRLLAAELADPGVLEGFRPGPEGDRVRAEGDALAYHVGAGNVAGVCATSILRSLLVRTPLLMKPGRGDVVLPVLLARAIAAEDAALGCAVAVAYWRGGTDPPVESLALERAGRVVVYGGTDTERALRDRLPVTTPVVAYRHRVSVGAVARERLDGESDARAVADEVAGAASAYDQRGCVSPQVVWIEEGGRVGPSRWAELLGDALDRVAQGLPPGPPDPALASAVHQQRGAAELYGAAGRGHRVFTPAHGIAWTVVFQPTASFEPVPPCRFVRVQPVSDLAQLPAILSGCSEVLQSVSLEAAHERRGTLAEDLARVGVTRVTTFRRQPWPRPWWTHDGQGPLRALLRWVTLEEP